MCYDTYQLTLSQHFTSLSDVPPLPVAARALRAAAAAVLAVALPAALDPHLVALALPLAAPDPLFADHALPFVAARLLVALALPERIDTAEAALIGGEGAGLDRQFMG